MSTPSIPKDICHEIGAKWLHGQSATQIVDWIHGTNHRRKVPIHTTRSSVSRYIERYADSWQVDGKVSVVRRCQSQAWTMLEGLEDVELGLRSCLADSATLNGTPCDNQRHLARIRTLAALERNYLKRFKLARLDGKTKVAEYEEDDEDVERLDQKFLDDAKNDWRSADVAEPDENPHRFDSEFLVKPRPIQPDACRPGPDDSGPEIDDDEPAWYGLLDAFSLDLVRRNSIPKPPDPEPELKDGGTNSNRIDSESIGKTRAIQPDGCAKPDGGSGRAA